MRRPPRRPDSAADHRTIERGAGRDRRSHDAGDARDDTGATPGGPADDRRLLTILPGHLTAPRAAEIGEGWAQRAVPLRLGQEVQEMLRLGVGFHATLKRLDTLS